jgi:hypothetical protein
MAIRQKDRLALRVPREVKKALRALALFKHTSINKVVAEIFRITLPSYTEAAIENGEINDPDWRRLLESMLCKIQGDELGN